MWDDLATWFQSPGGARVLQTAIIPAIAILVAGLLAAAIARSAVKATIRRAERVEATSAVAGLVAAARVAVDAEGDLVSTRRAARLRAEADVRVRLLPLAGADLAADWAAARMDGLKDPSKSGQGLAELRDRLVEWVGKPARAKRIFVRPAASATRPAPTAAPAPAPAKPAAVEVQPEPVTPEPQPAAQVEPQTVASVASAASVTPEQDRFARPSAPGPRRTPADPEPAVAAAEPEPELVGASAVPAASAAAAPSAPAPTGAGAPTGTAPAWQRTRAVERLQQERGRTRGVESPTADGEAGLGTAPVVIPHTHRAEPPQVPAQPAESDEAVRLEAHQQARHARPDDQAPAATGAAPAAPSTPAPAWLDTYDDEAQVTQNLDLKTPPPVAASAVRDRGTPGDDLVPRS